MQLHQKPVRPTQPPEADRAADMMEALEPYLTELVLQFQLQGWKGDEVITAMLSWAVQERTVSALVVREPHLIEALAELPDQVGELIKRQTLCWTGALPSAGTV